jgi:hypothetical protein
VAQTERMSKLVNQHPEKEILISPILCNVKVNTAIRGVEGVGECATAAVKRM